MRRNHSLDQMIANITFKHWLGLISLSVLCYVLLIYLRHLLPQLYQDFFVPIVFLLVIALQFFLPKTRMADKSVPKTINISKPLGFLILISNLVFGGFLLYLWQSSPEVWLFPAMAVFINLIGALVAQKMIRQS